MRAEERWRHEQDAAYRRQVEQQEAYWFARMNGAVEPEPTQHNCWDALDTDPEWDPEQAFSGPLDPNLDPYEFRMECM